MKLVPASKSEPYRTLQRLACASPGAASAGTAAGAFSGTAASAGAAAAGAATMGTSGGGGPGGGGGGGGGGGAPLALTMRLGCRFLGNYVAMLWLSRIKYTWRRTHPD